MTASGARRWRVAGWRRAASASAVADGSRPRHAAGPAARLGNGERRISTASSTSRNGNSINRLTIDWTAYRNSVIRRRRQRADDRRAHRRRFASRSRCCATVTARIDPRPARRSSWRCAAARAARGRAAVAAVEHRHRLRVGAFSGTAEQANAYARQIQDAIAARRSRRPDRLDRRSAIERRRQHVADDRRAWVRFSATVRSDISSARPGPKRSGNTGTASSISGAIRRHHGDPAVHAEAASAAGRGAVGQSDRQLG